MTDPNTPPSEQPGSGAPTEGSTPQQTTPQTAPTEEGAAWRKMVPAEFRDDPSLKDYKDFGAFIKSHVHLTQLLGREPRVPGKDAPPDAWNQFYKALGRPDTPDQYQVPVPEGRETNSTLLEGFRKVAHEIGLTGSQAHKLAEWHFGALASEEDEIAASIAARNERVERELKREWGQAYENNVRLATKFAKEVGGDELLEWLEVSGEGSNPHLIRAFVKAARERGEDRLGASRGSDFGYTPAEAQAEIGRLRADKDFSAALYDAENPGHKAAVERMKLLHDAAFPTQDTP